ncbi:serine protease [Fibrisoma montanum]|uniref:Serine protease n=1 Tax=Fibrisoma montanum TaxID=2305895 RepID=A0A418MBU2_9BACT|nr:trypsin-like peptidase domain-containing protein [Fibrisoma montanum]RIV23834.1 serine protease [Fibrisoma montanum]
MFHEPPKNFLYSAYKIEVEHSDGAKSKSGVATGFVLEIAERVPWIITNRHVIDIDYKQVTPKFKDFKLSKLSITGRRADDSEYTFQLHEDAKFYFHEDYQNDIAIVEAKIYHSDDKPLHWHFGLEHLANNNIYKELDAYDEICYTGFPNTYDKFSNRPIIRSGRIASDPRFDYSWNRDYQGQCVAYEGFSSEGASGSPIFAPPRGLQGIPNSRHGYLIGVNAGHIPDHFGHSGISYFYKTLALLEIIEKNKLAEITS